MQKTAFKTSLSLKNKLLLDSVSPVPSLRSCVSGTSILPLISPGLVTHKYEVEQEKFKKQMFDFKNKSERLESCTVKVDT